MTDQYVIETNEIWKRYGLPFIPRLRQTIDKWRQQEKPVETYGPWSLRDVSFNLKKGETVGIIGHNGAGKSTLLKVLAGVTPPTMGEYNVNGRVFPMIELNAGLHMELTGRQNTYMLGAVMGLTRAQIADRIEYIKEFSELQEWFDRPIRKYSSGMLTRLGFSVAIYVDADILLVDEVLSVGDITFQRKCFDHMEKIQADQNTSIIFVSHSIRQVERLCERTMMLDQGQVIDFGKTGQVVNEYYSRSNANILQHRVNDDGKTVVGYYVEDSVIQVSDIRMLNDDLQQQDTFSTGEDVIIEVDLDSDDLYDNLIVGYGIATVDSFYVTGFTNENAERYTVNGKTTLRCRIKELPLLSGIYLLHIKIRTDWGSVLGGGFALKTFSVIVPDDIRASSDFGVIMLNVDWQGEELKQDVT